MAVASTACTPQAYSQLIRPEPSQIPQTDEQGRCALGRWVPVCVSHRLRTTYAYRSERPREYLVQTYFVLFTVLIVEHITAAVSHQKKDEKNKVPSHDSRPHPRRHPAGSCSIERGEIDRVEGAHISSGGSLLLLSSQVLMLHDAFRSRRRRGGRGKKRKCGAIFRKSGAIFANGKKLKLFFLCRFEIQFRPARRYIQYPRQHEDTTTEGARALV